MHSSLIPDNFESGMIVHSKHSNECAAIFPLNVRYIDTRLRINNKNHKLKIKKNHGHCLAQQIT